MGIRASVFSTLRAIPALAGMPIRPLVAQPNDKAPYVVYTVITGRRVKSFKGDSGLANPRCQIDVYAADILVAEQLQSAIRVGVLADPVLGAVHVDDGDGYEQDTKLVRLRTDFSLWIYD